MTTQRKNLPEGPWPPCMMPDGGECCPQYHEARKEIERLRALPMTKELAQLCKQLYHRRINESPDVDCVRASAILAAQYRELDRLRSRNAELEAALRDAYENSTGNDWSGWDKVGALLSKEES